MTAGHRDPTYVRNARRVRERTTQQLRVGAQVVCIGCGGLIEPGQPFDVGHLVDLARGGSNALDNLGPQHRRENRAAGGRIGAAKTNGQQRWQHPRATRLPVQAATLFDLDENDEVTRPARRGRNDEGRRLEW